MKVRCFKLKKQYDTNFKEMVVEKYKSGSLGGELQVAKHYKISRNTLRHWIEKDRIQGNQINDINCKRGRKSNHPIDYKERYEILKKYQAFLKAQREKK